MLNVIISGMPGAYKARLIDAKAGICIIQICRTTRGELLDEIEDLTTML